MSAALYTGIPLALFTTVAFNSGLIIEKRALERMPTVNLRHAPQMIVGLVTSPSWLAGFTLMFTGLICQVVVLTFEPVSIVQPILASGIAVVLVLSRLVLRERLGRIEFWCVAVLAVSLALLALSDGGNAGQAGRHASAAAMTAVIVPSLVLGLLIAVPRGGASRAAAARTGAPASLRYGIGTGILYGVSSLATKALSGILAVNHTPAGIAEGVLSSPYLYLLGCCSAVAMLLYQAALQASRASILIPASTVTSSLYFVVAGTWLFHESLPSDPVSLGLRVAGIALAGVVLITLSRQTPSPPPRLQETNPPQAGSRYIYPGS